MKHLRKFNESKSEYELRELCDTSFAFLIDEGFKVEFFDIVGNHNSTRIKLRIPNERKTITFPWSKVSDYYIPFLQLILNRYKLDYYYDSSIDQYKMRREDKEKIKRSTFVCIQQPTNSKYLRVETILEDSSLLDELNIVSISIKVIN